MGVCYFCHWGWPKPIADIYKRHRQSIDDLGFDGFAAMHFGPAHCVWEDENFGGSLKFEFEQCDEWKDRDTFPPEVIALIRQSLVELLAIDDGLKEVPEAYDGDHPELCPPPWEAVRNATAES